MLSWNENHPIIMCWSCLWDEWICIIRSSSKENLDQICKLGLGCALLMPRDRELMWLLSVCVQVSVRKCYKGEKHCVNLMHSPGGSKTRKDSLCHWRFLNRYWFSLCWWLLSRHWLIFVNDSCVSSCLYALTISASAVERSCVDDFNNSCVSRSLCALVISALAIELGCIDDF